MRHSVSKLRIELFENEKCSCYSLHYLPDGMRRAIGSGSVFFSHGWDFDDVIVLEAEEDLELIPLGEELNARRGLQRRRLR